MLPSEVTTAIGSSLDGLRLLDHPFYRSWQDGGLSQRDLAAYAEQYRYFEQALPGILSSVADSVPSETGRELVQKNLDDELSRPEPHAQLFEGFAEAVGARASAEASRATRHLIGVYAEALDEGPVAALSVIAAYEVQAGDIASTKAASLSERYGLGSDAIRFWVAHSEMETEHADWTADALGSLKADPRDVSRWARRSASAWWGFLDERSEQQAAASV